MKRLLSLFLSLFVISPSALAQAPATVVSIGDSDTLRVSQAGKTITVRLACIDAPEMAQKPWGPKAAARLKQLLPVGQTVTLYVVEQNQYGRSVGEVFVNGDSVNLQMVMEGHAVVYQQYLKACKFTKNQYLQAEAQAKSQRLGFWGQTNPQMPWDFRSGKKTPKTRPVQVQQPAAQNCDPSYPDFCLPPNIPDLDCSDIPQSNFRVVGNDPHRFDGDGDGIGCER